MRLYLVPIIIFVSSLSLPAHALDKAGECFLNLAASSAPETSIKDVADRCAKQKKMQYIPTRLLKEKLTENNDFVITPHKQNYVLPITHQKAPNQSPYDAQKAYPNITNPVQYKEAKLQVSLKVPLYHKDIFTENDGLYFGFTLKSFWQVYNNELSAPFRETNYQPELFYQAPISSTSLGGAWLARAGIEHQSNGQTQLLSRSWNRVYLGLGFQKDNWGLYIQPWYRLPEDRKIDDNDPATPLPPEGDDNPDIDDYLGHYSVNGVVDWGRYVFTSTIRHNFSTGYGSIEAGMSFPLWGRLKGFVQFFDGYGESLIDYDHHNQRIGLGILLTDIL